ncbi:MAG: type I-F CRISPR-associated protein Csy3 [Candidatus Sericytochromatia bacterium]
MTKKDDVASVLAFEKKLVPSDGYFYGSSWNKRKHEKTPLQLSEKSVRGTISNRLKAAQQNDPAKLNAAIENPNLQTVDSCALGAEQDTLVLNFTLKVLPGVETPSACNNSNFQKSYTASAKKYIATEGFAELAKRYSTNLANGRFLWRNRLGAEKIEIEIKDSQGEVWLIEDALSISTRDFETTNSQIDALALKIADALSGKSPFLLLDVTAYAQVGKSQEVYPSEELVMEKGKGKKSKILYAIEGIAGMHSQKIGNALRTIDTWYPEFEESTIGPIAIEPYGAVTNLGKAYRTPKDKVDFYTLFDAWARGKELANKEQTHYVMATLVRGGVFGESGKD